MKRALHKSSTAFLRNWYSITQQELAGYLGISPSLLAMFETGKRGLPTAALVKLAELEAGHEKNIKANKKAASLPAFQKAFKEQDDKTAREILGKANYQRARAGILQRILKEKTEKQEQDQTWLGIIDKKLAALPKHASTKGDRLWFDIQRDKVSKRLLQANNEQVKLQLAIELLQAAADIHEAHHGRLKKRK